MTGDNELVVPLSDSLGFWQMRTLAEQQIGKIRKDNSYKVVCLLGPIIWHTYVDQFRLCLSITPLFNGSKNDPMRLTVQHSSIIISQCNPGEKLLEWSSDYLIFISWVEKHCDEDANLSACLKYYISHHMPISRKTIKRLTL